MQGLMCRSAGVVAVALLSACTALPPQGAEPQPEPVVEAPADIAPREETYTVKAGDTLIRIALDSGESPADLARWNGIADAARIVVGQVLRLVPPAGGVAPSVAKPPTASAPTSTPPAITTDEDINWMWPVQGAVLAGFNQNKNKGLEIAGAAGDAVLAAADGKVVYAGTGLRGYGNLIILKHNKTYVSLYAHNQALLVKEDDVVKRGQKIAEMGRSEADRVKLSFEVRKSGNSVDPAKYLPAK